VEADNIECLAAMSGHVTLGTAPLAGDLEAEEGVVTFAAQLAPGVNFVNPFRPKQVFSKINDQVIKTKD
jgi:hypothetical protein